MKNLCRLLLLLCSLCIAFGASAQESKVQVVSKGSKELKRSAHRLNIPVEQLNQAREVLEEATDLVKQIKPYPASQLSNLIYSWQRLNRKEVKSVVDSFLHDLRLEAAAAADFGSYQLATSTAVSIMQSHGEFDYEEIQQMIQGWPYPPASAGEAALKYLENLESSVRQNALRKLAGTDPQKAQALLLQGTYSGGNSYDVHAQIAQGLMRTGKKDEALAVIERTVNDFSQNASNPQALLAYQNFAPMAIRILGSARAGMIMDPWIERLKSQPSSGNCNSGTVKAGDTSVDLSCAEWTVLNFVRSYPLMPGFVTTTLDSLPGLKSKLDRVGGIDSLYDGASVSMTTNYPKERSVPRSEGGSKAVDMSKLIQELKGEAESNPGFVKGRLQKIAEDQQGIENLVNLANMASYEDPDLASLALEIAQDLLPQVDSLQKRSSILQNMVRAYRQVDGEVDTGLLRDGFILADELREEGETANGMNPPRGKSGLAAMADQLEVLLISELSKDSYEQAIQYVRSLGNDTLKLTCLVRITQALSQPNY